MSSALQKIAPWLEGTRGRWILAALTASTLFLSFIPFHQVYFLFLFPLALDSLLRRCRSAKEGLFYGVLASTIAHLAGFYWVTFVVHEFGFLPWVVSGALCVLFCIIASMNMPLFGMFGAWFYRRTSPDSWSQRARVLWYTMALPAAFTAVEFSAPKLFPFYFGHSFYFLPLLTQISEITGPIFLTFASMSVGGVIILAVREKAFPRWAVAFPVAIWIAILSFGAWRLATPLPVGRELRVALIQPNIGSLIKESVRRNPQARAQYLLDKYFQMTDQAMKHDPKPEIVLWPETAMPFVLDALGYWQERITNKVLEWQVPLVTGAYALDPEVPGQDYNAAFLLIPKPDGTISRQIYRKSILLAFGEYFPGGDLFPFLYRWFPQVSHFSAGTEHDPFILPDGLRLGATICYEAIVPRFYRKTIEPGVVGVLNLTNDSWFGPTTEPWHHAALASFRAIEHRVPLIRVTNTGVSLVVDRFGRYSKTTGVYEEGILHQSVALPPTPPRTFYLIFGDWFVWLSAIGGAAFVFVRLRRRGEHSASVPV